MEATTVRIFGYTQQWRMLELLEQIADHLLRLDEDGLAIRGSPPASESPTRTAPSDAPEQETITPPTLGSPQSVQAALNAGQNSVSLVGVCPYCEHELLIPVEVAVGETT